MLIETCRHAPTPWLAMACALGLASPLVVGCGLPSQLESPWRGNHHDQGRDPEAEPFQPDGGGEEPPTTPGDAGPPETPDGGRPVGCGDGVWSAQEACDSSADDRFPCDGTSCELIRCGTSDGQHGDRSCKDLGDDAVCVRYNGQSVCLPQAQVDSSLIHEEQQRRLYTYCARQSGGDWHPVDYEGHERGLRACHPDQQGRFNDDTCRDGSPESDAYRCQTFPQPPENRALVLDENLHNQSLLPVPKWRVLEPGSQGAVAVDLLMACEPDNDDFCRFGYEPSLRSYGLRPKCSGEGESNSLVMEAVGQDRNACILAECLVEDVETCLDDFPIVNPTCSDNGRCLADIEGEGRNTYLRGLQQELYHQCTTACNGAPHPIDFYQNCWADGSRNYPNPTGGSITGPDLRCASCGECDQVNTLACWPGDDQNDTCSPPCQQATDCPHGGECRAQDGVSLCVSMGGQSGHGCDQQNPCAPHQACESGQCQPRLCDPENPCPEGTQCNDQNRCEPNQGGGQGQAPPQRCTPPDENAQNPCQEGQYCNHVWDSDEQDFGAEGVCSGNHCLAHGDCGFGQFCLRTDNGPGYCSPWTGCQHFRPNNGESATGQECFHGHQFCVPIQEMDAYLRPLPSNRCVMHIGCDNDQSCRNVDPQARCANRSCVRMDGCGQNGPPARNFPGICVDSTFEEDGHPNSPNQWLEDERVEAGQHSARLDGPLDRDAFFFRADVTANYTFRAQNLEGDPWCRLFETEVINASVSVNPQAIQGNDGGVEGHDTACQIVQRLEAGEEAVFLVEPEDLSFDFNGMDYTVFISRDGG